MKNTILAIVYLFLGIAAAALLAYVIITHEQKQDARIRELEKAVEELGKQKSTDETEDPDETGKTASEEEFKYLAIGNSLTIHVKCDYWWNVIGMAATTAEKDYVHIVTKALEEKHGKVSAEAINFSAWEIQAHDRSETIATIDKYLTEDLDLVTLQLSENVTDLSTFTQDYMYLVNYIKEKCPDAQVITIDEFWDNGKASLKKRVAEKCGVGFADLSAIRGLPEYQCGYGTVVYGDDGAEHKVLHTGVSGHPGDKGMQYIADAVIALLE